MKNFKLKAFFLIILLSSLALVSNAAEFYFDSGTSTISSGQQFKIDFLLNTQKENINAIEGKIIFDNNVLELSEIRDGNSLINFWVEKPNVKNGAVTFAGTTPGGYIGDKGLIFSLIFTAKTSGDSFIKIENGSALKNDGLGTSAKLKETNSKISILKSSGQNPIDNTKIIDKEKPETFKPEIGKDPSMFDNKWFVVFATQDKISGTDKYEIKENKYNIFDFSKWVIAVSPYVLIDQNLTSNIYIKAIDKAGNERIVKLSPRNPIPWYANIENWVIIVLVLSVALLFIKKLWKNS